MESFRYKALDDKQQLVEGEVSALTEREAFEQLHAMGLFPIEARVGRSRFGWLKLELVPERRLRRREITILTKQLSSLLAAGIELERALAILAGLTDTKLAAQSLEATRAAVTEGATLADALDRHLPGLPGYFPSMVRAGELGGSLVETFGKLSDILQRQQELRDKVTAQLVYPAILLVTAALSLGLLIAVVLPQFEPIFRDAGQAIPLPMAVLLWIGHSFESHGPAIGIVMLLAVLGFRRALSSPAFRLRFDGGLLRLPAVGSILIRLDTTSFARTLGTLLANGVAIVTALGVAKSTAANAALRAVLDGFEQQVREGASLTQVLDRAPFLPPLAARLVRVGEESGSLEDMLLHAADLIEQEAERRIQRLVTLLTPTLTIVLGIGIAAIMASIMTAILSVNEIAF